MPKGLEVQVWNCLDKVNLNIAELLQIERIEAQVKFRSPIGLDFRKGGPLSFCFLSASFAVFGSLENYPQEILNYRKPGKNET